MPHPLQRKCNDGMPYERLPEIEDWISKLEKVDPEERIRQFASSFRTSPRYVPSEVLVYFLRSTWAEQMTSDFEKIFRILMKRIEQSLCSAVPESRIAGAKGIREEIMGRFAERIAKDCKGRSKLLDFYEIRFDKAFVAFRTSMLRQIGPSSGTTIPLSTDDGDTPEISREVEDAAADFLSGDPQQIDDPAFRSALNAAINSLPDDQKQVVGLLLQGFQIDSKDKDVLTIARLLRCDERTVRNRRDRAFKALRTILHEEYAQ